MIKLERTVGWYRPYTVVASGKEYVLDNIKFYDKDGNILSAGNGWLQCKAGSDIPCIELDIEKVTRRNKEKFDGEVFGMTMRCSYSNETRLVLYIPMDMLNIKYEGKKKMCGDRVYECYTGDQGVYVTKYVESLDKDLRAIKNDYTALLESVELFKMERNPEAAIEGLYKMIETIKKFQVERQNIDNIVVEG